MTEQVVITLSQYLLQLKEKTFTCDQVNEFELCRDQVQVTQTFIDLFQKNIQKQVIYYDLTDQNLKREAFTSIKNVLINNGFSISFGRNGIVQMKKNGTCDEVVVTRSDLMNKERILELLQEEYNYHKFYDTTGWNVIHDIIRATGAKKDTKKWISCESNVYGYNLGTRIISKYNDGNIEYRNGINNIPYVFLRVVPQTA